MTRYPGYSVEIETALFRRTKGEARIKGMDAAQLEAHKNSLPLDERDDYLGDGSYAKELAAWVSSGLQQAGLPWVEDYKEDLYRVVVVAAPSGGRIHIVCGNMDEPDAKEDGNRHLIGVDPKPTFWARVFKDAAFEAFCDKVNQTVNRMISTNFEIKIVRKL